MAQFDVQEGTDWRVDTWVKYHTKGRDGVVEFGAGRFGYLLATEAVKKIGIELFKPYVDDFKERFPDTDVDVYLCDMRHYRFHIKGKHDVAMFIDSIEHLSKSDGVRLLRRCQEDFKKIIVFGPVGFHPNEAVDGNEGNLHLSSWEEEDLRELGFKVDVDAGFHKSSRPDTPAAFYAVWEAK